MNKAQCLSAAQYIRPGNDFTQRTMAYLRHERDKARKRTWRSVIAAAAFAACSAFALLLLPGLLLRPSPTPSGAAAVATASASTATQSQRLVLDGNPVPYSSLQFGYTKAVNYPDVADQTLAMDIVAFSEEMLAQSHLVARVTVEDVRFNQYFTHTYAAVYTLRIERIFYQRIFYSEPEVGEGDTFVVEQVLYGGTLSDTEFGLKPGGRYILPIRVDAGIIADYDINNEPHIVAKESPYSFIYPFQPMIELTADGGYLFYGTRDAESDNFAGNFGWKSLVNDDTVEVIMDVEAASGGESWIDRMKLRADAQFEDDFQALVDDYCAGDGAGHEGAVDTVPQGNEITGGDALSIGRAAIPEGLEISAEACRFDTVHRQWNVHFEFYNTQSVYDFRLSPTGALIEAEWSSPPQS